MSSSHSNAMHNYLICGGAGFIGSHVVDELLAHGHHVTVLDDYTTSTPENLHQHESMPRLVIEEHDVTDRYNPTKEYDYILHFASIAAPDLYQANPIQTLHCGSQATENMLQLAENHDATFLFASTSEVYGNPKVHPQPESYAGHVQSYGPRACYDESKRYAEALIRGYQQQHGVDARIVRIFNTYGPRLDDSRVIPTFVRQAVANEPITVHGDGSQTRSFCYIADLVAGILDTLNSEIQEPINLGNPDERTIINTAKTIRQLCQSNSEIIYTERPTDDPDKRCPDISKAKDELGWEPTTTLKEGLRETIEALT